VLAGHYVLIFCYHFYIKVNKGVEASLVQLLETGLLRADPHPGNLRYTPEGRVG
jgi:aarF domain-containing kinase